MEETFRSQKASGTNFKFGAAGKPSTVNVPDSCPRQGSEKRITLMVAWWGPGMRAEPGAPGQGPCRLAPSLGAEMGSPVQGALCLKTKSNSLTAAEAADSSDARAPQANPGALSDMHSNITLLHACEQRSGSTSESVANSDTDSETMSETEHTTSPLASCELDSHTKRCKSPNSESNVRMNSSLLWLLQCQLAPHQQPHMLPAGTTASITAKVCSSQSINVSTASFDKQANSTAGLQEKCQGALSARGHRPPTVSPVWVHVSPYLGEGEERCGVTDTQQGRHQGCVQDNKQDKVQDDQQDDHSDDQGGDQQDNYSDLQDDQRDSRQDDERDDQQDQQQHDPRDSQQVDESQALHVQEGTQPAAKRHKQAEQHDCRSDVTYQQQVLVPLPPLRFFLCSADEISLVYQPRTPALTPAEQ